MNTENKKTLKQRLLLAMSDFKKIVKDTKAYNYKYATLDQVLEAIEEPLFKNDLLLKQDIIENEKSEMLLKTTLYDALSEDKFDTNTINISSILKSHNENNKSKNIVQELGSIITYCRRYALLTFFSLAPEDDDGRSLQPNNNQNKQQQYKPKPAYDTILATFEQCTTKEEATKLAESFKNQLTKEQMESLRDRFKNKFSEGK